MKKYYVFLFGIIFVFIFTGCSLLLSNAQTVCLIPLAMERYKL